MSTDLHTALEAAITARLEVARAVCREPKGITWRTEPVPYRGDSHSLTEVIGDLIDPLGLLMVDPEVAAFINVHHPADAIRRYERDLRVLKRHRPVAMGDRCLCDGVFCACSEHTPWSDCREVCDLLDVYPEVTL